MRRSKSLLHEDGGLASPDGGLLAVSQFGTGGVTLIETSTNQVARSLPIDGRTLGINFSPDGTVGYATDLGSESFAADPIQLVLNGNYGSVRGVPGHITVFNPASGEITTQITLDTGPTSLGIQDR